ncbi:MAG: TorF family putative porin [Thiobacillus sp.]
MKKIVSALMLAGMVGAPAAVMAEDSASSFSGNVSLTSDYIFRGISQTGGDAAIQGGLDYTHASGFYLGTWGSNVGWIEDYQGYNSGNIELDLYGGYRGSFGPVSYDIGLIGYFYPGSRPAGVTKAETTELYLGLGWEWFSVKYSYALSDSVFGFGKPGGASDADGSSYLDISVNYPVSETGLTLGAHWGTFKFENYGVQNYDDWKVSASYDMGKLSPMMSGVTLGVAYSDTNAKKTVWTDVNGRYLGDSTTFVWISKAL